MQVETPQLGVNLLKGTDDNMWHRIPKEDFIGYDEFHFEFDMAFDCADGSLSQG